MAKATEEKKKDTGDEEMIERPKEPMFSKMGMMLLIGSNLLVAILVLVGVSIATAGGGDDAGEEQEETGTFFADEEWLDLEDMTTPVAGPGGKMEIVRFRVMISFQGGPTEQADWNAKWAGKRTLLQGWADSVMSKFELGDVRDRKSFRPRFQDELKDVLNNKIKGVTVEKVVLTSWR